MDFVFKLITVFWSTLRETGPFLVLGLVFAGVLHVLVPARLVLWALGSRGWKGAFKGSLIGMPLPLCSCGVVPTALTLRRQGASLSATTSFTISTPETSIDALAITAALLPTVYLGVRPLAALILAFLVGLVVEFFSGSNEDQLRQDLLSLSNAIDKELVSRDGKTRERTREICQVCGLLVDEKQHRHKIFARIGAVFRYAFGTFFKDIASWLMIGLFFATVIQVLAPADGFSGTWIGRHSSFQILIAILLGIPLYSCATATTPLAAVLLAKGMAPGAALALLLAGPATNVGNVFALKRELGLRVTGVYYGALFVFCFCIGMAFNFAWPFFQHKFPQATTLVQGHELTFVEHGVPGIIEVFSALLLLGLSGWVWTNAVWSKWIARNSGESDECCDHEGHSH